MTPQLSVIVPTLNDQIGLQSLIPSLVETLQTLTIQSEILVVDDGSCPKIELPTLKNNTVRLLRHRVNKGYGAAIKTGIRDAQSPVILVLDADGQHDPADIPRFLKTLEQADLVVGLRTNLSSAPLWRRPGKAALSLLFRFLTGTRHRDFNCGYRCMRKAVIQPLLPLCSDRFSFSMSSTVLVHSSGYEVQFLPIQMRPRTGTSTVSVRTGFETLLLMIRMIVFTHPLRFFLPISFVCMVSGLLWGLPYAWQHRGVSIGALLLWVTGLMAFFFGILSDAVAEVLRNLLLANPDQRHRLENDR